MQRETKERKHKMKSMASRVALLVSTVIVTLIGLYVTQVHSVDCFEQIECNYDPKTCVKDETTVSKLTGKFFCHECIIRTMFITGLKGKEAGKFCDNPIPGHQTVRELTASTKTTCGTIIVTKGLVDACSELGGCSIDTKQQCGGFEVQTAGCPKGM